MYGQTPQPAMGNWNQPRPQAPPQQQSPRPVQQQSVFGGQLNQGGGGYNDPRPQAGTQLAGSQQQYAQPRPQAPPQQTPPQQLPPQQAPPSPQLSGNSGQFTANQYQNPQMDPWKQKSQMLDNSAMGNWNQPRPQRPEDWRLGSTQDQIPGAVWGSMGLWSRGGW